MCCARLTVPPVPPLVRHRPVSCRFPHRGIITHQPKLFCPVERQSRQFHMRGAAVHQPRCPTETPGVHLTRIRRLISVAPTEFRPPSGRYRRWISLWIAIPLSPGSPTNSDTRLHGGPSRCDCHGRPRALQRFAREATPDESARWGPPAVVGWIQRRCCCCSRPSRRCSTALACRDRYYRLSWQVRSAPAPAA